MTKLGRPKKGEVRPPKPPPNPVGSPPYYSDPTVMEQKINEYFAICAKNTTKQSWINKRGELTSGEIPELPTVEGIALHLGFAHQQRLWDYSKKSKSFEEVITRAKTQLAKIINQKTMSGMIDSRAGMLNLTSNYGYSNKQVIEIEGEFNLDNLARSAIEKASQHRNKQQRKK